jgi:hypothetical protein
VPVWHAATRKWAKDGRLVVLGVTQEQHPERCRLFAQWKGFDWPILHDPINVLESSAVPLVVAIDEHGIVRSVRPRPDTFEKEFLDRSFADDPSAKPEPARYGSTHPPAFDKLAAAAKDADTAAEWRALGDALVLWGGDKKLDDAIAAYSAAVKRDPKGGAAHFRLGVALRKRWEAAAGKPDDFRRAVEEWGTALDLDLNQYIWRRRIQQYGSRLDKPYPFYDWVGEAESAIRARGETPVALPVRPDGAEIAKPSKTFDAARASPRNPGPQGKVARDKGSVGCEAVAVPAAVTPGESARVHLTFRLAPKATDHWNNESYPLRVWVDAPEGVAVSARLVEAERPKSATSAEARTVGFEVQLPKDAKGVVRVPVFALYHLCDDDGGQCRFLRLDATVELRVKRK